MNKDNNIPNLEIERVNKDAAVKRFTEYAFRNNKMQEEKEQKREGEKK